MNKQPPYPSAPSDQALLQIDLGAMTRNYAELAARANPAQTACVVKSDAYGLGMEAVSKALLEKGCRTFFVAQAHEGARLRQITRKMTQDADIYVLNGLAPTSAETLLKHNLIPCLGSLEEIAEWRGLVPSSGAGASSRAALHIDTGFNRLGLPLDDIDKVAGFNPHLVMSHLACGDEPAHKMNAQQLKAFTTCLEKFPDSKASLANSAGVLMGAAFHFDLTRVGTAMYGGAAILDDSSPCATTLETVVSLYAPVLQTKFVQQGQSIGYGARFTAPKDMEIAVLALGYGDGFTRQLSEAGANASYRGALCPIIGRISMDLLALDISATDSPPQRGDFVEMIGDTIKIEPLARQAGTISYELFTQLGTRYKRQYISN